MGVHYKKFVSGSQYKFFKDRNINQSEASETTHIGAGSPTHDRENKASIHFTDD